MIALPLIFDMNLVEVWQLPHTRRFLKMQSAVPGGVPISPNAMASFSLWWHKCNFSSSSTSCKTNFVACTYPAMVICLDNPLSSAWISPIWGWSPSSTTNVCTLYSLQSMCTLTVFPHLFLSSAVGCWHWDPICQQQHICLIAAHNQQNFQGQLQ